MRVVFCIFVFMRWWIKSQRQKPFDNRRLYFNAWYSMVTLLPMLQIWHLQDIENTCVNFVNDPEQGGCPKKLICKGATVIVSEGTSKMMISFLLCVCVWGYDLTEVNHRLYCQCWNNHEESEILKSVAICPHVTWISRNIRRFLYIFWTPLLWRTSQTWLVKMTMHTCLFKSTL